MSDRNHDRELKNTPDHKYAYDFDSIMYKYMIRAFLPFFTENKDALELGSHEGAFTELLAREFFNKITCVEISQEAAAKAEERVLYCSCNIDILVGDLENIHLKYHYDNIILTHVLEHLDNPVKVLRRINDEWLYDTGRLFLVVPNATAASRQIAVKMGLIEHNSAITKSEHAHGHRVTYTFDTLERDCKAAGLRVVHRSGIFFKALANFQWDKLLKTDIITPEYLDGCYELGQQYPELCSSIFFVCEKGK